MISLQGSGSVMMSLQGEWLSDDVIAGGVASRIITTLVTTIVTIGYKWLIAHSDN